MRTNAKTCAPIGRQGLCKLEMHLFKRHLRVSKPHLPQSAKSRLLHWHIKGADDRLLMSEWGQQVSTITQTAYSEFSELAPIPNRDRKRIVFVSAHFRSHTIERLFSGWVTGLEPAEFDVHFVSTSGAGDRRTTDMCAAVSGSFTASTSIIEIASHIHKLAADIIIYPDIGMDPRTQVLAALRLAPRQAMSWGHPVTSGLPTIDTFLSSALMEPNGSQAHYTENLVCLPHLSIDYARPSMPKDKISHDFQCAQSLFKIPPHQDHVFAKIIKQIPGRTPEFLRASNHSSHGCFPNPDSTCIQKCRIRP